ncbi:MAG: Ig-like domain repeat protein [Pseudonocardiaceae bacterium]
MRKGLALFVAVAVAAGIVVLWQPATATATTAVPPRRHPTARVCPDNGKRLVCFAIRQTDTVVPNLATNALPNGFGPADLRSAYGLTTTGSAAMTVAIVDAFDDPHAEADLGTYRSTYGLPACTTANGCFRKVNQGGQASPLPRTDTGWAGEISLDVDMVSAICPNCNILLVEANNPNTGNLGTAVNTAVNLGAKFVSNSYGGPEDGSENSDDSLYFNHPGVVITASTGDNGFGVSYPASGKGVTAVGGTSLTRDTSTRGWSEAVWNGAGSGCSGSVAKPTFQVGLNTGCGKRAEADVAAVADPQTGVAVYQTFGASGWAVYGGTSAASPIIASVYALAGNPGTTDSPNSYPYAHTTALNDVTTGSNGNCGAPLCTAGPGYDGPTGLGTPQGTSAFSLHAASSTTLTSSTNPSLPGQAVTFTATVTSPAGTPTGTVTFTSDGNALGTVGLTAGQATLTTSTVPVGAHTIAASYTPDANVAASSTTVAFTVDGLTYATLDTSNISRNLPVAALLKIYQCDSTLPPNTFEPLLPQFGSGTRKYFLESILHVPGGDRSTYTTEFPCVKQTDSNNNPLLENTGNLLTNDRQIEPYSILSWIAQTSKNVSDVHGETVLGNVDGIDSLAVNSSAIGNQPAVNAVPS